MRKSFVCYTSWHRAISKFSVEEKAAFVDAMFNHFMDQPVDIPKDMVRLEIFWDSISYNLEEMDKKYKGQMERISKARNENPKVRNLDSLHKASNDNVNANDNVNVNVKDNVKEKTKVEAKDNDEVYEYRMKIMNARY